MRGGVRFVIDRCFPRCGGCWADSSETDARVAAPVIFLDSHATANGMERTFHGLDSVVPGLINALAEKLLGRSLS